jgi:ABC-type uncharacterized transport system YnjBCD permease subunit
MSDTPIKADHRILKWSASVLFIACWLVPVIPVNYKLQPLWPYISEFIGQLRAGYFFGAAGYAVLLILLASITFLLSVSLGWLVERGVRLFRRGQPEKRS